MGYSPSFSQLPPVEQLRAVLRYDASTGKLFWLPRGEDARWNKRNAGKEAFTANGGGYRKGAIFGKPYCAHRVIWKLVHGEDPQGQIDHINWDRADNRLANLRVVTNLENARNRKPKAGESGITGVARTPKGFWRAYIDIPSRQIHLGHFDTPQEAEIARKTAERLWKYLRHDA